MFDHNRDCTIHCSIICLVIQDMKSEACPEPDCWRVVTLCQHTTAVTTARNRNVCVAFLNNLKISMTLSASKKTL